jgi:hypothetical protein
MVVISVAVAVFTATLYAALLTYSPTYPAEALLLVVVPTIPPVVGLNVIEVAVAAPNVGVTNAALVVKAIAPLPFTVAAKAVATPLPSPDKLATGYAVQFDKLPLVGVPNNGVTSVGEVDPTNATVPVCPARLTSTELFVLKIYAP